MQFLYIGNTIKTEDCNNHKGASVAGNKMQLGIVKALKAHFAENMTVFTEYPIASFPKEKVIVIPSGKIILTENLYAIKVPFINIFLIKQISKVVVSFLMIIKWALKSKKEDKVILCFNSFPDIALPVLLAKKLLGVKTICLLADLPIDVVKRGLIGKISRMIEDKLNRNSIKKFDALVVLNKNTIAEYAPKAKYTVLDGGFDINDAPTNECGGQWNKILDENEPLRIIYSGELIEYNGIINLLEAVKHINNPRFQLEIYGSGPLEAVVKQNSERDNRIKYMGRVSNAEMIKIQQNAALLVNPRPVNNPVSMVTFPSKMIEYMLSGTPVVSTKLNGFTPEYLDHLFIFEDESPQAIAKTIDLILSINKDQLIKKTIMAREFIVKTKNWGIQSKKVLEAIEMLNLITKRSRYEH